MTLTIEQLLENPKEFVKLTDEEFSKIFKAVIDLYTSMDLVALGFECVCKIPSEIRRGEFIYLFRNSKEIEEELAMYPPHTYLHF